MLSHAAGVISAAKSGDTGALAGHVVGLLGAVGPASILSPSGVSTPSPVVAPGATSVAASAPADVADSANSAEASDLPITLPKARAVSV